MAACAFVGILTATITTRVAVSQQPHLHQRPGSIIGSETPWAIPDDVAYVALLRQIGNLQKQNQGDLRLASYLHYIEVASGVDISETDLQRLVTIAREYHATVLSAEGAARAARFQGRAVAVPVRETKDTALKVARTKLTVLQPETRSAIDNFVQNTVKRRMKLLH
jgi:hypothetical protein